MGDTVDWLWISLGVMAALLVAAPFAFHVYIRLHYLWVVVRIFQEKPIFIMPFGQPTPDAEELSLPTDDGLTLQGCYLKTTKPRKGVLLFGLEFGANRWACVPYCEFLRDAGYDICTIEMRGQGKSPAQAGYEPLQWVTDFEVLDYEAAIKYLKARPDRDARGIGLFGLSKGASAALIVAAHDDFIRCFAVDGIFATLTTMLPFMKHFVTIYTRISWVVPILPEWYLVFVARIAMRQVEKLRGCHYADLEDCIAKLAPRPLLMIHGGGDSYIKPEMAKALFDLAHEPKEFWLVENAKHNQAFHLASDEYKRRVLAFFDQHLAACGAASAAVCYAASGN